VSNKVIVFANLCVGFRLTCINVWLISLRLVLLIKKKCFGYSHGFHSFKTTNNQIFQELSNNYKFIM